MFRLINVQDHERGLWFRRGKLQDLILPGSTWLLSWQDKVHLVSALKRRFEHPLLDVLVESPVMQQHLEIVELGPAERAIVWEEDRIIEDLGPGLYAFWKAGPKLMVDRFSHESARTGTAGAEMQIA